MLVNTDLQNIQTWLLRNKAANGRCCWFWLNVVHIYGIDTFKCDVTKPIVAMICVLAGPVFNKKRRGASFIHWNLHVNNGQLYQIIAFGDRRKPEILGSAENVTRTKLASPGSVENKTKRLG